jgi:hypothetical protein
MAFLPVFWAIPTEILSGSKAAVVVGTINALAASQGLRDRTRLDISALKPDLSSLDSRC